MLYRGHRKGRTWDDGFYHYPRTQKPTLCYFVKQHKLFSGLYRKIMPEPFNALPRARISNHCCSELPF